MSYNKIDTDNLTSMLAVAALGHDNGVGLTDGTTVNLQHNRRGAGEYMAYVSVIDIEDEVMAEFSVPTVDGLDAAKVIAVLEAFAAAWVM